MDLLAGWYPGLGEVEMIRRMSPFVREFISDASAEYDGFISEYLLPVLDEYQCPEDKIISDIALAVYIEQCEQAGLGSYDDMAGLGELGGVLKKIKKSVKKTVHKVIAPVKRVAEKVIPKPILNVMKKGAAAVTSVHKKGAKVMEKIEHAGTKIGQKYGNVIIGAAGAILAPFTGGASLAAAAALTAANSAYQKKRAADRARKMGAANAAQITSQAQQQQNAAMQELDAFYAQNQQWFLSRGITPERWAAMTFDQKVAALQGGMGSGGAPVPAPPPEPMPQPEPGGFAPPPSGGGGGGGPSGGGGGGGGGGSTDGASYGGSGQPGTKVATASMFDSSMLPLLAAGVALAFVFGKPAKSRRTKRNPARRYRRRAA